jgi:flagellar motor switch protein FliG
MKMLEKRENKYDPAMYGRLRSEFLRKLDTISSTFDDVVEDDEKRRQDVMREIKEGKLVIIRR